MIIYRLREALRCASLRLRRSSPIYRLRRALMLARLAPESREANRAYNADLARAMAADDYDALPLCPAGYSRRGRLILPAEIPAAPYVLDDRPSPEA